MHKRTLARAAAALLTTTVALSATATTADAKPKAAHGQTTKVDVAAKQLAAAKRTTTRAVSVADARLARAATDSRIAAGIASDRDQLAELGAQVTGATTLAEVRAIAKAVQAVRVEVWAIAVDVLTDAEALAASADELAAALDLVVDVSPDAYLAVEEALTLVDTAVGKALATTSFGGKAELLTAYDDLAAAGPPRAGGAAKQPGW